MKGTESITFTVNGESQTLEVDPEAKCGRDREGEIELVLLLKEPLLLLAEQAIEHICKVGAVECLLA